MSRKYGANIVRTVRETSESRRKYGKRETSDERVQRLHAVKELKLEQTKLKKEAQNKNPDSFFYDFYSVGKNLVKEKKLGLDDLKRTKRYVESEIRRCEKKIEDSMTPSQSSKHIRFTDDGEIVEAPARVSNKNKSEFADYIDEMKNKLVELDSRIKNFKMKNKRVK